MRKYIPLVISTITWIGVITYMIAISVDFKPNMMFDLASAGIILFSMLSFLVSIVNGVITGLCLQKEKEIAIPAIIHGAGTAIVTLYAITYPEEINFDLPLYLFIYILIGGVTGGLMVGIAFFVKIIRAYVGKIKIRKKKEPPYSSGYPPHDF